MAQSVLQDTKGKDQDLTRSAGRGALYQVLGGGGITVIRLGASAVLARALIPEDFGLFGLALIVREFIRYLGALGMGTGIIAKKEVTEEDLNTCFWSLAVIRFFLFIITFLLAPLAAIFFNNSDVTPVLRVVAFTFLFSAFSGVSVALLQKKLYFGKIVIINIICALIESSIAVTLAVTTDYHYWALVIGMMVSSICLHTSIVFTAGWFPRFMFSKKSFKYLFYFGINNLGASIVNYFHQNIDYLLVGRILGTTSLGFYQFAYQIPHLIFDRLARPIGSVVFPALSRVQEDDERLIAGFLKTSKYVALFSFPALGGLAVLAYPTVTFMWGKQWLPIVFPLQILCLTAALRCTVQSVGSIFLCKNRPDIPFKFGLARLVFTFFSVGIFAYLYDLNGVAIGMLVSVFPTIIILYFAFKMTNTSLVRFFAVLKEPVMATFVSMFFAYAANYSMKMLIMPIWVSLCVSIISGVIGYFLFLVLVFPKLVREILETINKITGYRFSIDFSGK